MSMLIIVTCPKICFLVGAQEIRENLVFACFWFLCFVFPGGMQLQKFMRGNDILRYIDTEICCKDISTQELDYIRAKHTSYLYEDLGTKPNWILPSRKIYNKCVCS